MSSTLIQWKFNIELESLRCQSIWKSPQQFQKYYKRQLKIFGTKGRYPWLKGPCLLVTQGYWGLQSVCYSDLPTASWPESTKSVCDLCLSTCLSTDPKSQSVEPRPKSTSCGARCPKKTSNMNHLVIAWIYVRFSLKILRLSPRRQLMFLNLSFLSCGGKSTKTAKEGNIFQTFRTVGYKRLS